jgi:hypothetical protein
MGQEQPSGRPVERGIFDGFEGYMSPTDENYRHLLTKGLVVPDANVLLNLYRYTAQTRTDLFAVLEKIGNQLWAPNQVVVEFWRSREFALREPRILSDKTLATLDDLREQSVELLAQWANRIALPAEDITDIHRTLREAYRLVADEVAKRTEAESAGLVSVDTNKDQILNSLQPILKGRVGPPMEAAEYAEAVEEGMRRLDEGIPPGFKDNKKDSKLAVGDYLVWAQVLKEAGTRRCDVLIVTDDVKEDWWRKEHGEIRGPRLELVDELRHQVGTRLFMMRPRSLLLHAKKTLRVKVSDTSVQDVERVERSRSFSEGRKIRTAGRHPLEKLPEGRTGNYLDTIIEMTRLAENIPDMETFLDSFQERFPTITLREEARRRMRVLLSLGLGEIRDGRVRLTPLGEQFLDEGRLDLLQESLLQRIAGATEIIELAKTVPLSELRMHLRDVPPDGVSATQALLVLRYLEQLEML